MDASPWPELLPFVFQCAQSPDPRLAEASLLILVSLASYLAAPLRSYMGTLHTVLSTHLSSQSPDVAAAAVRATVAFVASVDTPADRDALQSLVPAMLASIAASLNAGDETAAQDAVEAMMEVAEDHPRFLRRHLAETVTAMLHIAEADTLDPPTRQLAAELVLTLCEAREKAPGMMRRLPAVLARLFQLCVAFLLDIEDDPSWHRADTDAHANDGDGELFEFGQECLDRLALALGGGTVAPLVSAALPSLAAAPDWRKRHAALVMLAQVAEGCAKALSGSLAPLVDACLAGLADPHPKVRWAACQAVGQACTDLGPSLQRAQGARILPALVAVMRDAASPRVQAHAAAALVNFTEAADARVLAPHLDALVSTLLSLLASGPCMVTEGALTALASVADASKTDFEKHYDSVMPLLRSALAAPPSATPGGALLRAKALECASLVGMAVGPDKFRPDAHAVMALLQSVAASGGGVAADDPTASYALQAGARLCKCLGRDFLPYLGTVMPPLLAAAQAAPDVSVTDADDEEGGATDDDDDAEIIIVGGRRIQIRTSALEDKATACAMLVCYAEELRDDFFPYVEQVTGVMVPLLKFYFHEGVRQAAAQALPELLRSAATAAEAGAPGADAAYVARMVAFVWPPLLDAVAKEPEPDVQATSLEAVRDVIEVAGPAALTAPDAAAALDRVRGVLEASAKRRAARAARRASEDFDAEEADALDAELEGEEDLLDAAASVVSAALAAHGDALGASVDALMPHLAPLLDERNAAPGERRVAVCVVDDVIEHCAAASVRYAPQAVPVLLGALASPDPALRQCGAYGLGVLAEKRAELATAAGAALGAALTKALAAGATVPPDADDDDAAARDNVISALGKLVEHAPAAAAVDGDGGATAASAFVAGLPLRCDVAEARASTSRLVRLVEASDARVLGAGNANLPAVVAALGGGRRARRHGRRCRHARARGHPAAPDEGRPAARRVGRGRGPAVGAGAGGAGAGGGRVSGVWVGCVFLFRWASVFDYFPFWPQTFFFWTAARPLFTTVLTSERRGRLLLQQQKTRKRKTDPETQNASSPHHHVRYSLGLRSFK